VGIPVELSLKTNTVSVVPLIGAPEKFATSEGLIVISRLVVSYPKSPEIFNVTVYVSLLL